MAFKVSVDKDDMPKIIKLFNTNYPNTFYDILGEEEIGEDITKVLLIVNSAKEDEIFEDLFDILGDLTVVQNTNNN
jgi:hypothetical protein